MDKTWIKADRRWWRSALGRISRGASFRICPESPGLEIAGQFLLGQLRKQSLLLGPFPESTFDKLAFFQKIPDNPVLLGLGPFHRPNLLVFRICKSWVKFRWLGEADRRGG